MFENLQVLNTTTTSIVRAQKEGNPFTIRAIVGTTDGKFLGASFIEVMRGERVIPAGAFCSDYGVEHTYTGEDADLLTELCHQMNEDLEGRFRVTFLVREPAPEDLEPRPPVEETEEESPATEEQEEENQPEDE